MKYKQRIGKFGERLAINYLIRRGYKILATNLKVSYQEIDIFAQRGKTIVFIEVKTRTTLTLGQADQSLTIKKMANIRKALDIFVYEKELDENYIRLDLISIDINRLKKKAKIKHYRDII